MTDSIKIAVASGKGGTGKTLIATNLFYTLKEWGKEVTLVDCDAEEPNDTLFLPGKEVRKFDVTQKVPVIDQKKCIFCGKCREFCNYNAILCLPDTKYISVVEDLCHGCGACLVACRYDAITEKDVVLGRVRRFSLDHHASVVEARTEIGIYSPVSVIKAAVREAGPKGIVIMDAPPGTSCPFIQTVVNADYTVLVTEPTPFGLSDLKQSVETLKTMNKPSGVIVNRAGMGSHAIYDYLVQENLPLLMEIPFDRSIAATYSEGKLIANGNNKWKDLFKSLFDKIQEIYGNSSNQR